MTREAADRSVGSCVVAAAIFVMEIEDVFVASIACEGHIRASWAKIDIFRSGISGTASMTKSTLDRSSIFVVEERRFLHASASSLDILCFETSFSRSLSVSS